MLSVAETPGEEQQLAFGEVCDRLTAFGKRITSISLAEISAQLETFKAEIVAILDAAPSASTGLATTLHDDYGWKSSRLPEHEEHGHSKGTRAPPSNDRLAPITVQPRCDSWPPSGPEQSLIRDYMLIKNPASLRHACRYARQRARPC